MTAPVLNQTGSWNLKPWNFSRYCTHHRRIMLMLHFCTQQPAASTKTSGVANPAKAALHVVGTSSGYAKTLHSSRSALLRWLETEVHTDTKGKQE